MHNDDEMMKKMLMKRKPMLTIQIGQAEMGGPELGEAEEQEDESEAPKDLAPQMAEGEGEMDMEKMAELEKLKAILGDEAGMEEKMPDRKLGISEMAKMNMQKRYKELNK